MIHIPYKLILAVSLIAICFGTGLSQDPNGFRQEVDQIILREQHAPKKKRVLFTGSSSIRLWTDLKEQFSEHNVLNTGFGGSQMSDLYYYADELILNYRPGKIFIYEGDNDLGQGETSEQILSDAGKLLSRIRCSLPKRTKVYFITPKPSIRRWELRDRYEAYIKMLKAWTAQHKNVYCIDVWTPMLDEKGELRRDLFIEDDLHMNERGYALWTSIIKPFVSK